MQLKPEEITRIIKAQIKHYQNVIEQSETGTVILVGDGIARAVGLEKCMSGDGSGKMHERRAGGV